MGKKYKMYSVLKILNLPSETVCSLVNFGLQESIFMSIYQIMLFAFVNFSNLQTNPCILQKVMFNSVPILSEVSQKANLVHPILKSIF